MFHSILAAVDGSAPAMRALAVAAGIARRQGARLTVLTAVPGIRTAILPSAMAPESAAATEDEAGRILARATAILPAGLPASIRVGVGTPAAAIAHEVDAGGHDLVVVGSRGRGALRSTLLGSVARSVVGTSAVPVLVVKGGPDAGSEVAAAFPVTPFARVLVAIDGSDESVSALEQAADLAAMEGAALTVVTVTSVHRSPGMPESALVRIRLDAEEYARSVLDDALERVAGRTLADSRLAWGRAETAILAEIEAGGHDLLVLGSRGRGALRATLLGSLGYAMLRRCGVPVLIARPPARRDEAVDLSGSAGGAVVTD